MVTPNPILSLENSFVLMYVKLFANPEGGPSIKDDRVLHTYDTDLNRLETFAQLDDIYDLDDPFLNAYSAWPRRDECGNQWDGHHSLGSYRVRWVHLPIHTVK